MDINTSSYANVDWKNLATEVMQEAGLAGVTATGGTVGADGNLTLSFTGADGRTATLTMPAPELDEATGTLTEEGLGALEQKLKDTFAELQNLTADPPKADGSATSQMLFDIYQLMQLMLEIAKKQKEVSVAARQADLARVTADIQSKAAMQRTAAKTGLVMSICFSLASITAQAVAAGMSAKAQGAANNLEAAAGIDEAQQNLQLLSAKDTAQAAGNVHATEKGMSGTQLGKAREAFAGSDQVAGELRDAITARDTFKDNATKIGKLNGQIDQLNQDIRALGQEIDGLQQPPQNEVQPPQNEAQPPQNEVPAQPQNEVPPEGEAQPEPNSELAQKQAQKRALEDKLQRLTTERDGLLEQQGDKTLEGLNGTVDDKKRELATKLNLDQARLESALGAKELELVELENPPANAEEGQQMTSAERAQRIETLKGEIKDLKAQVKWGKAHVVEAKMRNGLVESLAQDYELGQGSLKQKAKMLKFDARYKAASASAQMWGTASNLLQQMGQMLNAVTQGVAGTKEAAATEFEATAKTDEEAMDQSKDLVGSARELQEGVLDFLRQVLQAENQSINQIVA